MHVLIKVYSVVNMTNTCFIWVCREQENRQNGGGRKKAIKKISPNVVRQLVQTITCNWPITPSALSFYPFFCEIKIQLFVNVAVFFFPEDLLPVLCCPALSQLFLQLSGILCQEIGRPQRFVSSFWSPDFCTNATNTSKHTYTITYIIHIQDKGLCLTRNLVFSNLLFLCPHFLRWDLT